ncbi:ACP S-malonyltransferase [Sporosarcina sp. Marseille-Q4063]|uniref:ACP S-malonyltransferase n=1 Tax=Sporosarcina sp. Marseille-Q4063 TaxID=2810514 RepID=UPI001BAF5DA4|nr:ACP S-malonyltransferase [Sporosarcina sp. Marseille-Q4063]QUW21843.1 ACP S-malonyltransferase [Sporosarcina sp. Marseille-Q4063]
MTKIAFVFPGQGSQSVGMGQELAEKSGEHFKKADEVLGFTLSDLILEGPGEELTVTYNAQPALLTVGSMIASRLIEEGITPDFTAGHSLGEYTALVASGVLSFEDGVSAVHKRGLYMNEAVPAGVGAMAAILGLDAEAVTKVTDSITANGDAVQPANLNCPGQIVISGTKAGVEKACVELKEAGARRAIPLDVSGPFHSSLMKPAAGKLDETLGEISMKDAGIPLIANVNASIVENSEEIKGLLVEQLYSPVLWEDSVRTMLDNGVTHFIECGPGKVLSGLIKKIDRSATVLPVYDEESLEAVVEASKGWSK